MPTALALGAVVVYPLLYTLLLSTYDVNLLEPAKARFVGLANYASMVLEHTFWRSVLVTFEYTAGTVVLSLFLGLGSALLLNRRFRFRALARAAIILPWATPWLVVCLIWYVLLNPQFGLINGGLHALGAVQAGSSFLYQTATALPAVVAVTAWRLFPMATLLLIAALQAVPPEQYEAASVDGASA
ncbi:MAG: carbohydrate ABC transporter permease, partial [Chloroflexota bacterium]